MKKTVPLRKDLTFKTNISEITSIALDHEFNLEGNTVKGNLIVSGSYKINDISVNTEEFKYNIPVNIELSDRYQLDDIKIDIDDFYYEIVNSNILNVNIEVGLDNLKEKEIEPIKNEEIKTPFKYDEEKIEKTVVQERCIEEEDKEIDEKKQEKHMDTDDVKTLFDNFDESTETYATYRVCIVKESDTVESISLKYNVTKELLEQYNDLNDIKIGDKLIIPSIYNETN